MKELVLASGNPGKLREFRTILASEGMHPYAGKWWPPGHVLGYDHTFVNGVSFMEDGEHTGALPGDLLRSN